MGHYQEKLLLLNNQLCQDYVIRLGLLTAKIYNESLQFGDVFSLDGDNKIFSSL